MPWCEYLIKSFAYNRMHKREYDNQWEMTRYTVWHILTSSMVIDSKKLPNLQKFATGSGKSAERATETDKTMFMKEMQEYLNNKNELINHN